MLRQTECQTGAAHFVLEQTAERFHDFFEIHMFGQSADVVMRFDHGAAVPGSAFNHVRIDRALGEEIHSTDFFCLFLKYIHKLRADDLSLHLRIRHAGQLDVEALLRVHTDKVQFKVSFRTEDRFHLIAFIFAQKTMIHKDTGKLFAHCPCEQCCRDRRVHTAGEAEQDPAAANLPAQRRNSFIHKGIDLPVSRTFADIKSKMPQHRHAFHRVHDLRMKLRQVQTARSIFRRRHRAVRRVSRNVKPLRECGDIVCVTHKTDRFRIDISQQLRMKFL